MQKGKRVVNDPPRNLSREDNRRRELGIGGFKGGHSR